MIATPTIPAALAGFAANACWVAWAWSKKDRNGKATKLPKMPTGANASTSNARTWRTAAAVLRALPKAGDGIGIVLTTLQPGEIATVDLDHVRDPTTGTMLQWAGDLVALARSYVEITPSGSGLRIIGTSARAERLSLGTAHHPGGGAFEIYTGGATRYLTVTGDKLPGAPDARANIDAVLDRLLTLRAKRQPEHHEQASASSTGSADSQDAYVRAAIDGELAKVRTAREGSRNETLNRAAFALGQFVGANLLDRTAAEHILLGVALMVGLGKQESVATIRSGLNSGQQHPREVPSSREARTGYNGHAYDSAAEEAPEPHPDDPGPAEPRQATGDALVLSPASPLRTARAFVALHFLTPQGRALHHWNSGFYAWSGTCYPETPEPDLRARLYAFLDSAQCATDDGKQLKPFHPTRAKVLDVLDALRAEANLPATVQPPRWLDDGDDPPARDLMSCANGLLNLATGELFPHSPQFFAHTALDVAYDPNAPEPAEWLKFLDTLWPGDPEAVATLGEIFGLCLTSVTRLQKAFMIVGPKRSGKGTIARILTAVLGPSSVVAPTLNGLSQNFGLAPLIGKRLALISDARLGGRADQQVIAERILAITGEDALTVDRKNRSAWTGRFEVRFIVLTNETPRLADASGALASRFIVLHLRRSFYGVEDHGLTDRLLRELPGILNWAIAGWRRLQQRGHFVQPQSAAEVVRELEDLASPILAFLRERCTVEAGKHVEVQRFYDAWCAWCRVQGREPTAQNWFGRDLRAAIPWLAMKQITGTDGERYRVYEGVTINDP